MPTNTKCVVLVGIENVDYDDYRLTTEAVTYDADKLTRSQVRDVVASLTYGDQVVAFCSPDDVESDVKVTSLVERLEACESYLHDQARRLRAELVNNRRRVDKATKIVDIMVRGREVMWSEHALCECEQRLAFIRETLRATC